MKTPEARPRFQSSNRHYHRYRSNDRGWEDWIDAEKKPGSRRRGIWIATTTILLAATGVALSFYFDVL